MLRKIFALIVFFLPLLPPSIPLVLAQPEEIITIAFIPAFANDPFYITLQSGILQGLADTQLEVEFTVHNPEPPNPDSQIALLEDIIERGDVDYLIVAPLDSQRLLPVLQSAFQAGLEVMTVDTFIGDGNYTSGSIHFPLTHIGSDNFASGFAACQTLDLEAGSQIYIQTMESGMTEQRAAGCAAAAVGMEVITPELPAIDVLSAQDQTTAILEQYPDLAGIFGPNAAAAYGAGLGVQRANRMINVVGIDATTSTVDLLRERVITTILTQKPFEMGYWAATFAIAHALGYESIPKQFMIDTTLITAENTSALIYADNLQEPASPLAGLTIGFVPGVERDPPDPFYVTLSHGVRTAIELYGADLAIQAPAHFNPDEQIPAIESLIAQHDIDYLIAAPTDRDALIPILESIHESGIPVITVDTFIGDGDYQSGDVTFPLTYIGSDNVMGGYIGCSQLAMADILGTGAKIYIQNVRPGISSTDQRAEGCLAAAADFGLDIVAMDYSDNVIEDGQAQTIRILAEHPDIVGIFGTNVFSAQGAGSAVQEVGLGGIVEVVAFDATEFAINLLQNGTVTQVIAQKPADIGYFAVVSAIVHARGIHSIPKRWATGYAVINLNNVNNPPIARFIYREN